MSKYTPTTKQIAQAWHFASRDYPFKSRAKRAEFNSWLASERARIWDEGAYWILHNRWVDNDDAPPNPYRGDAA